MQQTARERTCRVDNAFVPIVRVNGYRILFSDLKDWNEPVPWQN